MSKCLCCAKLREDLRSKGPKRDIYRACSNARKPAPYLGKPWTDKERKAALLKDFNALANRKPTPWEVCEREVITV